MRRGATKEQIINTTQQLMAQDGIRALRVDQIAQKLGVSKRTLYELFIDKSSLVRLCLDQMSLRQRELMQSYTHDNMDSPLRQAGSFLRSYTESLMAVNGCFLTDVRQNEELASSFTSYKTYCFEELSSIITVCQKSGYLLPKIEASSLANRILETLLTMRHRNASQEELSQFCLIMLRGTSTQMGIDVIDKNTQQA